MRCPRATNRPGARTGKNSALAGKSPKPQTRTPEIEPRAKSEAGKAKSPRYVELDPERQPIAKDSMREVQQMALNPRRRAGTSGALSAHTHTGMQKTHPNPTHMIGLLCSRRVAAQHAPTLHGTSPRGSERNPERAPKHTARKGQAHSH